jgi:PAS domain S-box-containing protein
MTEDARNWLIPLFFSSVVLVLLASAYTWQEHHYAELDREIISKKFAKISRLEDATRDMMLMTNRPIILYYAGQRKPWDGYVIFWPAAAEKLLGWTTEDVMEQGLSCMIPKDQREPHVIALEKFADVPVADRKTSVIKTDAIHKDGRMIPVVLSVWCVGDDTRTVAATIDAIDNIVER